jgi:hypothetical protein
MSLRSLVYRSNACSMAEVSVLWSTTRKFFCASGGGVTCCMRINILLDWQRIVDFLLRHLREAVQSRSPAIRLVGVYGDLYAAVKYLVANDSEELPIFIGGGLCHFVLGLE